MTIITTAARQSARAQSACAMFGLRVEQASMRSVGSLRLYAVAARRLDSVLERSGVAFVTGPSGSGKSTIVRALHHRLARRGQRVICADPDALGDSTKPIVDLFGSTLPRALRQLARAGLADAMAFPLCARELSDGQRIRLSIALALSEAQLANTPVTVISDEFASVLDSRTASALAIGVSRWVRSVQNVRFVAAAARDEVLEALNPDVLIYQPLLGPARFHFRGDSS